MTNKVNKNVLGRLTLFDSFNLPSELVSIGSHMLQITFFVSVEQDTDRAEDS